MTTDNGHAQSIAISSADGSSLGICLRHHNLRR